MCRIVDQLLVEAVDAFPDSIAGLAVQRSFLLRIRDSRYALVWAFRFSAFQLSFCAESGVGISEPGLGYKGTDCSWQVWSRKQSWG